MTGICECGCGIATSIIKRTRPELGLVKGEYRRFIKGHNMRSTKPEYVAEDRGYETPCWIWQRYITPAGYGQCAKTTGHVKAARLVYERHRGPIPEGLELDHLCRVRACVNPDHLEPVTCRENLLRGESPSAIHARKTHCPKGHPYDEENTYVHPNGSRRCRICSRERQRKTLGTEAAAAGSMR